MVKGNKMFAVGIALAIIAMIYLAADATIDANKAFGVASAGFFIAAIMCFK